MEQNGTEVIFSRQRKKRMLNPCSLARVFFFLLLASFFLFLKTSPALAVVYVDGSATGAGNGTSWTDAYTDFQDGIDNATSDEVWVAGGTYMPASAPNVPSPPDSRYFHFSLKNGVSVYGGFNGTESTLSERDPETNMTYLSCDIGTADDPSDNCYHVFYHSDGLGLDTTALIDGFIISDGNANHGSEDINRRGGGMYNHNNSPTIHYCQFSDNNAIYGGGMRNWASSPVISECYFIDNTAPTGAGMYNQNGTPQISSVYFAGNSASSGGGGIYNYFSTPVISGCTFDSNYGGSGGGGIYNSSSSPPITNCTFDSNTLSGNGYNGQAIGSYQNNSTITNCTFSGHGNFPIYAQGNSDLIIKNSIFWNPSWEMGAYTSDGSTITVSYSVIDGGVPVAQGATDGGNNLSTDPFLGSLQFNGGFVYTIAIGAGSSAVNNATMTGAPTTDARGVTRDGSDGYYDIGAYELISYDVTPSVPGGNGTIAPDTVQSVPAFDTTMFNLDPAIGYHVDQVTGTCGGTLSDNDFTTDPVTGDCTVVGSFAINTYTVNSSVSGGNGTIAPSGDQIVNHGDTPSFTLTPATGYHVHDVTGTCGGTLSGDTLFTADAVTGNCTVIASFAINTYTVDSSVSGGNGSIDPLGGQTVNHGDTPSFTLTPDTGYHIHDVTGTCGGTLSGDTFTTDAVTSNCTVVASFAINTYTVNSSVSGGNGTIAPSGDQVVDYGDTPSFTLTPDSGYHIEQVTGTCGGTLVGDTFTATAVTADCTVIANFSDTYTVTSSVSGGNGTISPLGAQTVQVNDTPSFTLTPDTGYHIDSVTGTCGGTLVNNTFTIDPVTMSCTVIANFAINTYTVNSSITGGNGTISPSGDIIKDHGDTQLYTLTPDSGYHVDEVTGTCGGTLVGNTYLTNPITDSCTVIGSFTDQYTLTILFAGQGEGSVSSTPAGIDACTDDCSAEFTNGTEVTLTATPDVKSEFAGWSGNGCSGTDDCIVTMDQASDITATFENAFNWNLYINILTQGNTE